MFAFAMNGASDSLAFRIFVLMPDANPAWKVESILSLGSA